MLFLRTDWPKGHDTSGQMVERFPLHQRSCPVGGRKTSVVGFDFAQEEKGSDYQKRRRDSGSAMRVHQTILPKVTFQIENLINLD